MSIDNSGALAAYRHQIDVLEADPNATESYRDGLEQEFEAVKAQLSGSDGTRDSCRPSATSGCNPGRRADWRSNANNHARSHCNGDSVGGAGGPLNNSNLPPALQRLKPYIDAASRATGLNPDVIAAQIWQESRGDIGATSINPGNGQSDTGLMQINPDTYAKLQREHPELRGKSLSEPAANIMAGAYLMRDLTQQFGSTDLALRAYNSGAGSVDRSNANLTTTGLGDPNYVRSVDGFMANIRNNRTLVS